MMTSGGRYAEAGEMLQDILATRLRVFGPDYPFTLATRRKLAGVIAHQNHQAEAESELRNVTIDQARVLGEDHPDTLESRFELANVLALQGRVTEAISQLRSLLADQSRILGEANPDTIATRKMLADLPRILMWPANYRPWLASVQARRKMTSAQNYIRQSAKCRTFAADMCSLARIKLHYVCTAC
jgi:hypothetical protein